MMYDSVILVYLQMAKKLLISARKLQLKTFLQVFIVIVLMLAVFPLSINLAYAQEILLRDDFNNNNANDGIPVDWEEYSPWGEWYVENGEYVGTATNFEPIRSSYSIAGNKNWQDYSFSVKMKGIEGVDKTILFRFNEERNAYVLNMRSRYFGGGNDIVLAKKMPVGTTEVEILKSVTYINSRDTWYEIRVDVMNNTEGVLIKAFVEGSPVLEYLDKNQPIYSGAVGFEVWPGGYSTSPDNLTTSNRFDDALVTAIGLSPTPTPEPYLDVPDIKQYSSPWNDDEYDSALEWSENPTIQRWGCALTSATMILQYHDHQVNPDELNGWLNLIPDGYLRNGLLNWLAVSRYSFFNAINGPPILEFKRYEADPTTLENELAEQRPTILKAPGHFVVAKGKDNENFLVNDPASTNALLSEVESDHGGQYSAINSYIPTSTDLSYIMLVIDSGVNLIVYNPEGEEVGEYLIEEPLVDDIDHTTKSGEALGVFLLPKPVFDTYKVVLEGESTFNLEAYLYNEEGELIDGEISSFEGDTLSIFQLNYDEDPETETIPKKVTFEVLLQNLEILWLIGWIDDEDVYLSLKDKFVAAKFLLDIKGKTKPSKNILRAFGNQLEAQRGKHINEEAYQILLTDLQILLNSL